MLAVAASAGDEEDEDEDVSDATITDSDEEEDESGKAYMSHGGKQSLYTTRASVLICVL